MATKVGVALDFGSKRRRARKGGGDGRQKALSLRYARALSPAARHRSQRRSTCLRRRLGSESRGPAHAYLCDVVGAQRAFACGIQLRRALRRRRCMAGGHKGQRRRRLPLQQCQGAGAPGFSRRRDAGRACSDLKVDRLGSKRPQRGGAPHATTLHRGLQALPAPDRALSSAAPAPAPAHSGGEKGEWGGGHVRVVQAPRRERGVCELPCDQGGRHARVATHEQWKGLFFFKMEAVFFIFGAKMARPHSAVALCAALLVSLAGAGVCVCVRVQVLMPASACILSADARTLPLGSYCGAALTVRARAPL